MTATAQTLCIEVIYAVPALATRIALTLPFGATVADALAAAGQDNGFSGVALDVKCVGIFGKLANLSDELHDGDRVEIYRGPAADAKAARRARLKPVRR